MVAIAGWTSGGVVVVVVVGCVDVELDEELVELAGGAALASDPRERFAAIPIPTDPNRPTATATPTAHHLLRE